MPSPWTEPGGGTSGSRGSQDAAFCHISLEEEAELSPARHRRPLSGKPLQPPYACAHLSSHGPRVRSCPSQLRALAPGVWVAAAVPSLVAPQVPVLSFLFLRDRPAPSMGHSRVQLPRIYPRFAAIACMTLDK